jgi:hypothetical protein
MAWRTVERQHAIIQGACACRPYRPARSDGTGSSSHRWPRAWPGSSAGASWGHCPSGCRVGSSRRFFSAWCLVSLRPPIPPSALLPPPSSAYLAILQLEDQLHLVALDLLVDDLGGDPAVGGVGLPCPGAVLVDVCHGGGRVPLPLVLWWEHLSGSKTRC